MNKKAILKFGVIIIVGVVLASATISAGVLADAPTESAYSDILNNTDGDGSSSNPHVVTTLEELQAMNSSLSSHYVLGNDINASETEMWNSGAGFKPIGNGSEFSGNFNGQGFSVDGLSINRPNTNYAVGLFGKVNSADIKNIGVTNLDIQGRDSVGGLVGDSRNTNITKSYSNSNVYGNQYVGGLVGYSRNTNITKSYSNSNVYGHDEVGGLVGYSRNTNITKSYSNSSVTGEYDVGGLVGSNRGSSNITKSYSNSSVTGKYDVGGLVGENVGSSYINKSYSSGAVTGDFSEVGGLVGSNYGAIITNSYSSGSVSGNSDVGGLLGYNSDAGTVVDSYWNIETSTQSTSEGGATGLTTADMTGSSAETKMVGFDFTSEWRTVSASDADSAADSYPIILDSSEEEEAVIVSESSSEEYGGMSTLVSVALLFVLFSVMVLLLVKD